MAVTEKMFDLSPTRRAFVNECSDYNRLSSQQPELFPTIYPPVPERKNTVQYSKIVFLHGEYYIQEDGRYFNNEFRELNIKPVKTVFTESELHALSTRRFNRTTVFTESALKSLGKFS